MAASIAIVGAGPRGISITERIAAYLGDRSEALTLHIIDEGLAEALDLLENELTRLTADPSAAVAS